MTNQPLNTRSFVDHFLFLLGLILCFNLFCLPSVAAIGCSTITTIPIDECKALVALYNSTNGQYWHDHFSNNWNKTNTPCIDWAGVKCNDEGHVIEIDRSKQGLRNERDLALISDLTALIHLQELNLSENYLKGSIPDFLSTFTNLYHLDFSNNKFTAPIPNLSELSLYYLNLSNNQLTGTIPEWLNNLTTLESLYLDHNQFTDTIPNLSNLASLKALSLGDNPLKTSSIPEWIKNLNQLEILDLSNSRRTGTIPEWLNNLPLEYLQLDHNQLTDSIPNLSELNLYYLDLSNNQLRDSIPNFLSEFTNLQYLYLDHNQFTSPIPDLSSLIELQSLDLSNNQLSGSIPISEILSSLTKLKKLYLDHNQFTGTIPETVDLPNPANLQVLYLGDNPLDSGPIPEWIGTLTHLRTLGLSNSRRTGPIPEWLNNLNPDIEYLQLDHNQLTGPIPALDKLTNLKWLFLNNNRFLNDLIPDLSLLTKLEILSLESNQFSGPIPEWIGDLRQLNYLSLRGNQLTGSIPYSLSKLTNLVNLDLRYNQLVTKNKTLLKFLSKKNPAWQWTQTVPPTYIKTKTVSPDSIEVSWKPILYTGDGGYYQVKYTDDLDKGYQPAKSTTVDKNATSYIVTDLSPDTTYYFAVETYTPPHDLNQADLTSELSPPVLGIITSPPPLTPLPPTMNLIVAFGGDGNGRVMTNSSGLDCNNYGQKCFYSYDTATWVNLIAIPAPDSEFIGWSGNQSDCEDGSLFMNENHYCVAYFVKRRFPLTITTVGKGKVNSNPLGIECGIKCQYRFESNTQVTLTTTPDTNWQFEQWQGDCDVNGLVIIDKEKHCEAIFVAINHDDTSVSPIPSTDTNSNLTNLNNPPVCQDNNCPVTVVTSQSNQAESETITPAIPTNVLQPATETSNLMADDISQPVTETNNLAANNEIVELAPQLAVSPGFYDFGRITVGSFSSAPVVTVTNTGGAELQLGQLTVSNNEFLLTETCSNQTLNAGNHCTVNVIFQPQLVGTQMAYLAIPIAKPQQPTVTVVTLTGKGYTITDPNSLTEDTVYYRTEKDPVDLPLLVTFISPLTAVITPAGVKLDWKIAPADNNQIAATHLWRAKSIKGNCPQDISQYDRRAAIELENKPQLDYQGTNNTCYGLQLIEYNGEMTWYITQVK